MGDKNAKLKARLINELYKKASFDDMGANKGNQWGDPSSWGKKNYHKPSYEAGQKAGKAGHAFLSKETWNNLSKPNKFLVGGAVALAIAPKLIEGGKYITGELSKVVNRLTPQKVKDRRDQREVHNLLGSSGPENPERISGAYKALRTLAPNLMKDKYIATDLLKQVDAYNRLDLSSMQSLSGIEAALLKKEKAPFSLSGLESDIATARMLGSGLGETLV